MALEVPNAPAASFPNQARLDSGDIAVIAQGLAGDGVISGCAVTAQGSPNMTVAVAAGYVRIGGAGVAVTAGNVTVTSNSSGLTRVDLVVVNNSGTKSVLAGTPGTSPLWPSASGYVILARIEVPSGVSAITSAHITDKRAVVQLDSLVVNVKDYGAKGDVRTVADGVATASSTTFTSATAAFTSADVNKQIVIAGAGLFGASHATTIASVTNATTALLTAAALTTVSAAAAYFATDDNTALVNAIAATPIGGTLTLAGGSFLTATSLNINKAITIRDGSLYGVNTQVAVIVSADVTFQNLNIRRGTGQAAFADSSSLRSAVVVNAARFKSLECNYTDANLAPVYLAHGNANGSLIRNGKITNSSAVQNSCGVYVASGSTGNLDVVVDGVEIAGTGCSDGVDIYDASRCIVRNCHIHDLAILPTITITSGWSNVSGNVWRYRAALGTTPGTDGPLTDRNDGSTRIVAVAGTQKTEDTSTPASPAADKWGISGGYLYINLSGTDPNTVSITSGIISGYGITFYSTAGALAMTNNLVAKNQIHDVDGFGIYFQLGSLVTSVGNSTSNNQLANVCRQGIQHASLPFAGIGINSGVRTVLQGDTINVAGQSGKAAPGVKLIPSATAGTGTGRAIGVHVRGAFSDGFQLCGGWDIIGCSSDNNTNGGFALRPVFPFNVARDVNIVGCSASGNTVRGIEIDGSASSATATVTVTGGTFAANTQQGIFINAGKNCIISGAQLRDNGSTSQAQIRLFGAADGCSIHNCNIVSGTTGAYGIDLHSALTNTTIGTNRFSVTNQILWNTLAYVQTGGSILGGRTFMGNGSPEGVVTGNIGETFRRIDATGSGTSLYVKESGTGNTGWIAQRGDVVTNLGDANATATADTSVVQTSTALTAARVITLPAANAVPAGRLLQFVDAQGTVTGTNTVSWARAGSDTINGGTANVVAANSPYGAGKVMSDGTSKWTTVPWVINQVNATITGRAGVLTAETAGTTNTIRWYNRSASIMTITALYASVDLAPTGSAITVTVWKNGSATGAQTVTISAAANSGSTTGLSISLAPGDYLQAWPTAIGSTVAGSDLAVTAVGSY